MLTVGQGEDIGVWAFNCFLNSDSTVTFSLDPGTQEPTEFTTTYNYGQWVEFSHQIDTDAGTMNILIDGDCVGEFPYSSDLVGHINFYPTSGDGAPALYFVDDIKVSALEDLFHAGTDGTDDVAEMHMEMVFGPNPAKDNLRIKANNFDCGRGAHFGVEWPGGFRRRSFRLAQRNSDRFESRQRHLSP